MSTITAPDSQHIDWTNRLSIWRCPHCHGGLDHDPSNEVLHCRNCQDRFPIREAILVFDESATLNNAVAQRFYDSPLWPKFRFWEWFTFFCNGGERRSRERVLRHLPKCPGLKLLDVAIGDGVYLDWLPEDWSIVGVDVSWTQLKGCLNRPRRLPRDLKLAQCSAEALPFHNAQFDAVLSIGAFNYFNDPQLALREMVRVGRPGATIIVSDEVPNLTDRLIGRKIGWPGLDRWFVSRVMNLGTEFTDMVERYRDLDVPAIARRVLPDCRYELIWRGVGYVFAGQVPEADS
jgi:ubiquinone/menaquinone biosynthesis C-methylase UbiE/uncharacterized protein YbaR (Trm112 family)